MRWIAQKGTAAGCVVALLAVSCGSGAKETTIKGARDSAAADASRALVEALSPCEPPPEGEHVDGPNPLEFLASADEWVRVVDLLKAPTERALSSSGVAHLVVENPGSSAATREIAIGVHFSVWPGIQWALANGAQTSIASRDGQSLAVMVEPADGVPLFVGECQQDFFLPPLQARLGDSIYDVLRALPDMTPGEAAVALGVVDSAGIDG